METTTTATRQVVEDYQRLFVNRRAFTMQSMRSHSETGRHYYFRPSKKGTDIPLMLTDETIRQHLEGKITVGLYAINRYLLPAILRVRALVFVISPHGFRMWVPLDNPEYFFCQTAVSGRIPGTTTHRKPLRQSPGRSMRSRKLHSFRSISSWLTL